MSALYTVQYTALYDYLAIHSVALHPAGYQMSKYVCDTHTFKSYWITGWLQPKAIISYYYRQTLNTHAINQSGITYNNTMCVCVCVGCITEETLKEDLKLLREVHPEVDEVTLKKQNQYMWRNFYNNGQDTPKGTVAMS